MLFWQVWGKRVLLSSLGHTGVTNTLCLYCRESDGVLAGAAGDGLLEEGDCQQSEERVAGDVEGRPHSRPHAHHNGCTAVLFSYTHTQPYAAVRHHAHIADGRPALPVGAFASAAAAAEAPVDAPAPDPPPAQLQPPVPAPGPLHLPESRHVPSVTHVADAPLHPHPGLGVSERPHGPAAGPQGAVVLERRSFAEVQPRAASAVPEVQLQLWTDSAGAGRSPDRQFVSEDKCQQPGSSPPTQ